MPVIPTLTRRGALAATGLLLVPALLPLRSARASVVYVEDAVAIDGTDTVAYFDNAGPVAGDPAITHVWNGATWRFATTANRDAFAADPERWAPQYGGYCAFAMSRGDVASTVPEAWTLEGGKLYLNYSLQVRDLWDQERAANIVLADGFWPEVRQTLL